MFTLPVLRCLRSNFPESSISYLTSPEFAPLVESFSVTNEILTLDRALLKRFFNGGFRELLNLWRDVSRKRYDIVVDLQCYGETACLSWLTRAPQRWGQVHRTWRAWAYTRAVPRDEKAHPVDAQLEVLAEAGLDISQPENFFELPSDKRMAAERMFLEFGFKAGAPTVLIQPFTSTPYRDWPFEKSLALGRRLRDLQIQVLFGGGPADRERLTPAMADAFPVAAGTDLLTSCGLASRCALVIGPNTGLIHLATAAGCRVLLLNALGAKEYPYGHPEWMVTPRRARVPVSEIELDTVLTEVLRALESIRPQSSIR